MGYCAFPEASTAARSLVGRQRSLCPPVLPRCSNMLHTILFCQPVTCASLSSLITFFWDMARTCVIGTLGFVSATLQLELCKFSLSSLRLRN